MNIHGLVVQYPIALLSLYSILELISYAHPGLRRHRPLFTVLATLLFFGALGALAALLTGGFAEDTVSALDARAYILSVHDLFAWTTTVLYLILAGAYLMRVFDHHGWGNYIKGLARPFIRIWNIKKYLTHLILDTPLLPILVLLGFVSLFITNALGAAITYGPNVDPFVSLVYHLFWAQ